MNPKSTGKNKLRLTINEGINFKLVGISSHENDYRLVWAMNNRLNMSFVRSDNFAVPDDKIGHDLEFSKFVFEDEDRYMKFYLIANRCPDGFLLPEIKNFDFILQIFGESGDKAIQEMVKALRQVEIVSAAFIIKPESLKGIKKIVV